jgi:HD-like signal output (HDOD) protein
MTSALIQDRVKGLRSLPTLPRRRVELIRLASRPDVSAAELERTLAADPPLAGKILSVANSAYFGFRSQVRRLSHAATLIGFPMVRALVLGVGVFDGLSRDTELALDRLWLHSVATARGAELLAEEAGAEEAEEALAAGLLHDIGIIALARLASASQESGSTELWGMDHGLAGYWLTRAWGLPDAICLACRDHQAEDAEGLAGMVGLADRCATRAGMGFHAYFGGVLVECARPTEVGERGGDLVRRLELEREGLESLMGAF